MTLQKTIIKWLVYAIGLLPILILNQFVLPWIPIFGIVPTLLPLAAISVAVLEGPVAGAGYGLAVGLVYAGLMPGKAVAMIFALPLLSLCTGLLTRYRLRQNFFSALLCSFGSLVIVDLVRILRLVQQGKGPVPVMFRIAGLEILFSLIFLILVYAIYRWISRRVPQPTVL